MKIYGLKPRQLKKVIQKRDVAISVFGLGKVGLPIACVFAEKGFNVIGVDVKKEVVKKINRGISPIDEPKIPQLVRKLTKKKKLIATTDAAYAVKKSDVSIVIVPTLVKNKKPYLKYLETAIDEIAKNFEENHLIIISSTLPPGTSLKVTKKLRKRKKKFGLAHAPERVSSGTVVRDLTGQYPQIIGGLDKESALAAKYLYKSINPRVIVTSDITTAEMVKLAEMIERDVRIAYANELALICKKIGVDTTEVIKLANTNKPYTHILNPGIGVGGHCVPSYPFFLINKVPKITKLIREARKVNESMPKEVVKFLLKKARELGLRKEETRIGILGLAYRGNVKEDSNSPVYSLILELRKKGFKKIFIHDPFFSRKEIEKKTKSKYLRLHDLKKTIDIVILATDHDVYKKIEHFLGREIKVVLDGRNFLNSRKIESKGINYLKI